MEKICAFFFNRVSDAKYSYREATFFKPKKSVEKEGKSYKKMGNAYIDQGIGWRVARFVETIVKGFFGALLIFPLVYPNYRKQIINGCVKFTTGQEKVNIFVLDRLSLGRRELNTLKSQMKFETVSVGLEKIRSMKIFVKFEFKGGEIKKEFIFKKEGNSAFDVDFLNQKTDEMAQIIQNNISIDFDSCIKANWHALYLSPDNKIHEANGSVFNSPTGTDNDSFEHAHNLSKKALILTMKQIEAMGFPMETNRKR